MWHKWLCLLSSRQLFISLFWCGCSGKLRASIPAPLSHYKGLIETSSSSQDRSKRRGFTLLSKWAHQEQETLVSWCTCGRLSFQRAPLYSDGTLSVSQPQHCWQGDYGSLQPTACSLSLPTTIWRGKRSAEWSAETTSMACFGEEQQRGLILAIWHLEKTNLSLYCEAEM